MTIFSCAIVHFCVLSSNVAGSTIGIFLIGTFFFPVSIFITYCQFVTEKSICNNSRFFILVYFFQKYFFLFYLIISVIKGLNSVLGVCFVFKHILRTNLSNSDVTQNLLLQIRISFPICLFTPVLFLYLKIRGINHVAFWFSH